MSDMSIAGGVPLIGSNPVQTGIVFKNADTEQEMFIAVTDKFPQLGDMHIEGRRVVEVSVELFIELAAAAHWAPVVPPTKETDDGV